MASVEKPCKNCRGFGYTKGGPNGPWDKLDCDACNGTGTQKESK